MLLAQIATKSCKMAWTRDPFDRLISAEALLARAQLISKDETMLAHGDPALW